MDGDIIVEMDGKVLAGIQRLSIEAGPPGEHILRINLSFIAKEINVDLEGDITLTLIDGMDLKMESKEW